MIQRANIPEHGLSDRELEIIRKSIVGRMARWGLPTGDVISMADEAIVRSLNMLDLARFPNTRVGAFVHHYSYLKLLARIRREIAYRDKAYLGGNVRGKTVATHYGERMDMEELLASFPPEQRFVIEMRMAGNTCKEIGKVLGVTPQAVWGQLMTIRRKVTRLMPDEVKAWCKR